MNKILCFILGVLCASPNALLTPAWAQNATSAYWEGPRNVGQGVCYQSTGSGVTLQSSSVAPCAFVAGFAGPSTYSGTGHIASNMGINLDVPSTTGTCTQAAGGNDTNCDLNRIALESDGINSTNGRSVYLLSLVHNGGSGVSGGMGGLTVTVQTGAPVGGTNPGLEAAQFIVNANANFGGGTGTELGNVFGINPNVTLSANATHFRQLVGEEIDVAAIAGSSYNFLEGLQIIVTGSHAQAPIIENDALLIGAGAKTISNGGTVAGLTMGIAFGGQQSYLPFNASATIIGVVCHVGNCAGFPPGTVTHGVDFSSVTFSSDAFKSPGFLVDGSGNVTALSYKSGASVGVSCSGSPTASFASVGGIVTHC